MRRQVSLEEISDGRLYGKNDMVRACTGDCKGCSACCSGMGNSIILDPFDIYRLTTGLGQTFEELMQGKIELNVVDGVILPNLKMSEENETCAFLDGAGRCSIHAQRPGICRLFPLGRYYLPAEDTGAAENGITGKGVGTREDAAVAENGITGKSVGTREDAGAAENGITGKGVGTKEDAGAAENGITGTSARRRRTHGFRYFLQAHECPMPNKTKIKISKWIDTPELDRYERFVNDWHDFLEDVQQLLAAEPDSCCEEDGARCAAGRDGWECREPDADEKARQVNLLLLKLFFARPYEKRDFYAQFEERLAVAGEALGFA